MTESLSIREFNMDDMPINSSILIIGKRRSGKSWIMRNLIEHYKNIPGGAVISPMDQLSWFYKFFFPDLYIHYDTKGNIMKKVLLRQRLMMQNEKEDKSIDPSGFLVMDDCLSQMKSWARDQTIREILMNARDYKLTYLLSMQTPIGIPTDLRLNLDYVFLLKEDSSINRKKLYNNYASLFPTFESFDKVFTECTKDFGCMIIANNVATTIQEKVFRFKANDCKFIFGSPAFQNIHKHFYDAQHMKKTTSPDPNVDYISLMKNVAGSPDYLFDYFINESKFNHDRVALTSEYESEQSKVKQDNNAPITNSDAPIDEEKSNKFNDTLVKDKQKDFSYAITNNGTVDEDISKSDQTGTFELAYTDDTYQLSVSMTNLNNHQLIKTLIDHITTIKKSA